jgi:hypothetical protein
LLLDFRTTRPRGGCREQRPTAREYQRVVLDATAALIEAGVLVLEPAATRSE